MSIIGIIAVMSTICSFLFRYVKEVISGVPESGTLLYVSIWSIFLIPLSGFIIILIRIITFIVTDFSRFNVLDEKYKDYDRMSDEKYSAMIKDFKILLGVILFGELFLCFTLEILEGGVSAAAGTVCITGVALVFTAAIVKKKICWAQIWTVLKRLFELAAIEVIVVMIVLLSVYSPHGKVDVTFDGRGTILIQNAANADPEKEILYIYDEEWNTIAEVDISKEDVLRALTTSGQTIKNYKGSELGKAQKAYGETLYWKYLYNIENLKLDSGKYVAQLEIVQGQNNIQIFNIFEVAGSDYSFAVNTIHKDY